jgi:uncharacterized membrane protein (DUF4010 family)
MGPPPLDLAQASEKVAIALGLGLLVGLQRERIRSPLAGIRTFALITAFGAVNALLALSFGGWIVALGVVAVAVMLAVGNLAEPDAKEADPGLTTEMAALLMYGVGAYVVVGHTAVAVALGGGVALLLYFKEPMHAFVTGMGETDLRAIMQFVLIALVIFPVLPNQSYGPYGVLNPHNIWLMVVLIVGIGLSGYVAYKVFGQKVGTVLAGVLGGMISSTATTVSYARHAREAAASVPLAALVILIASTIAFARLLAEIAAVAPGALRQLAPPLLCMLALTTLLCIGVYVVGRGEKEEPLAQRNPAELRLALAFGALYAIVLVGAAAAQDYFGETGLYTVAIVSGFHDLDAITLSTARLVDQERIRADTGWRLILTAALSNLVVKAGIAGLMGNARLLRWIALPFGLTFLGGIAVLFLWPQAL